jgi:xanthine dehydrogenase accessory factor
VSRELELWTFTAERLARGERVMLLVVTESTGSSPGRAGYKMAVAADCELCGSIGGGVMEVNLVEQSLKLLSEPPALADSLGPAIREQVHQKNSPQASGMICSGKQTVIFKQLNPDDLRTVETVRDAIVSGRNDVLAISDNSLTVGPPEAGTHHAAFSIERLGDHDFTYLERLGAKNRLFIVGGGHCALALSELMAKMDFRISIFDDRPELNTLAKNEFADEITIIEGYDQIAQHIPNGPEVYVVVMTLGYPSDAIVIRQLIDNDVKYLGVLGSKAKMATLMKELKEESFPADRLARIHTPIGLAINSRTPEEIAVSIAAEIISIKNSD